MFKLAEATSAKVEEVAGRLRAMEGEIPGLQFIEVGIDVVRSDRSFDLVLDTRFASWADLDAYRVHPFHQGVLAFMKTVVERSVVVDYES
jgi:hypothetical protein